jgi:cell division septum initiation protein DivIVA
MKKPIHSFSELTKENRSLKKKIRELERQLKGDVKYKGEQMAKR